MGQAASAKTAAVLPSNEVAVRLGIGRAVEGLSAPQALYLRSVLCHYWQPNGPSLRESCRLARRGLGRIGWHTFLTETEIRRRFARLDQDMLRSMRA